MLDDGNTLDDDNRLANMLLVHRLMDDNMLVEVMVGCNMLVFALL